MLLSHFREKFKTQLQEEYPPEEISSFFNILMQSFLGMNRIDLALDPKREINSLENGKFEEALQRLVNHEPIQYITGETEFFGYSFRVNNNVLIPRPETEELVQWILGENLLSQKRELSILDIGTGSGCIAISLALRLPEAKIYAMDISKSALEIAAENALLHNANVQFIQTDILSLESLPGKYDIIVSNPPYVRELEKHNMHKNVLNHEPSLALYVYNEEPLIFYKKITKLATHSLKKSGLLYFEINQYLGKETLSMIENMGFETELRKDIFGNDRMIRGRENND